jgi:predicted esterase
MVRERFSHIGPLSLLFLLPVKSLSPLDLAANVPLATRVRMVVGSEDPVAPPKFTQEYAEALRERGIDVTVTIAPGLGHNILLEPVVLEQLNKLVATVKGSLRTEARP